MYAVMGPNGSGKSTLAYSIMGHPAYALGKKSKLVFNGKDITKLDIEKRAKAGIFLSFQSPLSLSGVKLYQMLQFALAGLKDALTIRREVQEYAKKLKINPDLLTRSLNEGASGGEKKNLRCCRPQYLIKSF